MTDSRQTNEVHVTEIVLGSYAPKQCARKVHNTFDPRIPAVTDWIPSDELQALFDLGIVFEKQMFDQWQVALGSDFVLVDESDYSARVSKTLAAISDGTLVVAGGQLPNDPVGHRAGKPDVLLRWSDKGDLPKYVPADIKAHKSARGRPRTKEIQYSSLTKPTTQVALTGAAVSPAQSFSDVLQLAHYTRMFKFSDCIQATMYCWVRS